MGDLLEILKPEIDATIERLSARKFTPDPIAGKHFSKVVSVMSSAYKRHGYILERAILEQLKLCPYFDAWEDLTFQVSSWARDMSDRDIIKSEKLSSEAASYRLPSCRVTIETPLSSRSPRRLRAGRILSRLSRSRFSTSRTLAGVAIGFLGVAVMIGPEIGAEARGERGVVVLAEIAVLAAALAYALAGIYGRRFRDVPPLVTATGQVTASSVLLCPLVLAADWPWTLPVPDAAALGALVGLGVLSTAAAYVIYFRLLATAGATNLLLVTFLIPVSAILLGIFVLGEVLTAGQLAGMGLIALGLAAIDGRLAGQVCSGKRRGRGPPTVSPVA